MAYRSLRDCVDDLERHGHLVRIEAPIDPNLEMAEIQRRVYASGGPAVYFANVVGSRFPAVSNLFGTIERTRFLFRDTLRRTADAIALKADPVAALRRPWRYAWAPWVGLRALPKRVGHGPIVAGRTTVGELPKIVGWPGDGGPFVTLPQVYTEHPDAPGPMKSNLGMYRIQLGGNAYVPDREVGLHYQIHRGIGVHHAAALARGESLRVSVFVGGPPAHAFAAVMPLPEGLTELTFAGMLGGRRFRWLERDGHVLSADADFCLVGRVEPGQTKPEGPFGDHLGYYSLAHEFPVMHVEAVYHRPDPIWPFTVVGRPPQEDTTFGAMIHELTGPMVPVELPGLHRMRAVDEAGVHPLMLAIGSERYVPYQEERRPQELLTIANAILGFNQASLTKFLWIVAKEDEPRLDVHDTVAFFAHALRRIDLQRDLHFQTRTTMDTLDYSGTGLNEGSKVVIAAAGPPRRSLGDAVPAQLRIDPPFGPAQVAMPGVLVVGGPSYASDAGAVAKLAEMLEGGPLDGASTPFPWVVVADAPTFTAEKVANLLWVAFTRSDPARDLYGVGARIVDKHWGSRGSVLLDARNKPHHAPALEADPAVVRRVDALAAPGGPLAGIL